jgi:hypothetical protein
MKLSRSSKAQSSATMPDWKPEIRKRLANLQLPPTREAAIVEELAQHLDDCSAELLVGGETTDEAYRAALAGVGIGLVAAFGLTRLMKGAVVRRERARSVDIHSGGAPAGRCGAICRYISARRATRVNPLLVLKYE